MGLNRDDLDPIWFSEIQKDSTGMTGIKWNLVRIQWSSTGFPGINLYSLGFTNIQATFSDVQ